MKYPELCLFFEMTNCGKKLFTATTIHGNEINICMCLLNSGAKCVLLKDCNSFDAVYSVR